MADDSYKTIKQVAEGYYTEKRSRFISYAIPVRTVEEVKEQLEKYRKQYYDARHVCWAYMLGPERQTFRANDDGEPSSTAGKPILGQINSNELTDLLIVVVRYFGGIELGTSGLIVALRAAASSAAWIVASDSPAVTGSSTFLRRTMPTLWSITLSFVARPPPRLSPPQRSRNVR